LAGTQDAWLGYQRPAASHTPQEAEQPHTSGALVALENFIDYGCHQLILAP